MVNNPYRSSNGNLYSTLPVKDVAKLASGFQIMVIVALNACVIVLRGKTPSMTGTNQHSNRHYSHSSNFLELSLVRY